MPVVIAAALLLALGSARDLPAISIDLGKSRVTEGTDNIAFSDLNTTPVAGTLSEDFFFGHNAFVRLFSVTPPAFSVLLSLQTSGNGLVGFIDGTGYLIDARGNRIPGYGITGAVSSDTGGMNLALFPLFSDKDGTPNGDVSRPIDFYGVHFDIIFPVVEPSTEVTGGQFSLQGNGAVFGIGPGIPPDIGPDGGGGGNVVSNRLTVLASGPCTMSPNYSNAVLEIGKFYSTRITPAKGFVLSNWVGTVLGNAVVVTNTPKLTFGMQSDLVLQANIIANPFIPTKGTYNGLFGETNRTQESSGFFTLTLTDKGSYSASVKQGSKNYPVTGQFDMGGQASTIVSRHGASNWALLMQIDPASQQLRGWLSNAVSGGWVAALVADRAVFNSRTNPAAQYAGKYTVNIPGATNEDGTVWLGDGYLALSVDTGGKVTYNGSLADGTSVGPLSVPVSRDGFVPLYAPLYQGNGSLWSGLLLDTNWPSAGVQGWLSWIKPTQAGQYYTGGLKNEIMVTGARFTPPNAGAPRVVVMTNGVVIFEGGDLTVPLTNAVTLTSANRAIDLSLSNRLSLKLTVSTGVFSGSVTKPGKKRADSFKGALFQDENSGYGYFTGTNQSGRVLLWPAP